MIGVSCIDISMVAHQQFHHGVVASLGSYKQRVVGPVVVGIDVCLVGQ